MVRIILICFLLFTAIVFFSCSNKERYYKTDTGLLYKLYKSDSKDSIARMGNTVKVNYIQKVGDRVIESTYDGMPLYYMIMPGFGNRYNPLEVFDYGLKKGDSIVTEQLVDSMLKKKVFEKMPPWMKKGDKWITYMKVVEVFTSDSLLQADKEAETKRAIDLQTSLGKKRISNYLKANNITAAENNDATFTQIIKHGEGAKADSGKTIKAVLHVQTLRDTVLTKNDTISFASGKGFFPPAIDKHFGELQKGTKIRIYLPAILITGVTTQSKQLKLDDDLFFELELIEIK